MAKIGYARVSIKIKVLMYKLIHLRNMVVNVFLARKQVIVK